MHIFGFYYGTWYGTPWGPSQEWVHWEPGRPNYGSSFAPMYGPWDGRDEMDTTFQLMDMKDAGCTVVVASWWGPQHPSEKAIANTLKVAANLEMKVCIYVEADEHFTSEVLEERLKHLARNYFSHPAYLQIEGEPAVFFWGNATDKERVGHAAAADVLQKHRREVGPLWACCDNANDEADSLLSTGAFNALHDYGLGMMVSHEQMDSGEFKERCEQLRDLARQHDAKWIPVLAPGRDFTGLGPEKVRENPTIERQQGLHLLKQGFTVAEVGADAVGILFNEINEGTGIERYADTDIPGDHYIRVFRVIANVLQARYPDTGSIQLTQ